jgi:hypothetical protein
VSERDIILCVDYGSRDLAVALAAERLPTGDILILDMREIPPPAIDSTCFEVNQPKLLAKQEPWYRKFDKRPRR